jgi:hypothetical protein
MPPLKFIEERKDGACLNLRIQPGAAKNEICGVHDKALKIRLCAPPVEGAANKALIAFLAKALGIRKSSLRIIAGQRSRDKKILVEERSAEEMKKIFSEKLGDTLKYK